MRAFFNSISLAYAHPYISGSVALYTATMLGVPNPIELIFRSVSKGFTDGFSEINFLDWYEKQAKGFSDRNLSVINDFTWGLNFTILKNFSPLALAYLGGMVLTPLALAYLFERLKYNIGKPKMAIKARQFTWFNALNPFSSVHSQEKTPQPIFNASITRRINEIIQSTKNIKMNKGYFQNVLLWGPGGTGKTMISEMIAINSDVNYIMMSGAQLGQFIKRGEHVSELNRLFERARKSDKPTIIFIDECEALCAKRDNLDQSHIEILDTFLNLTGVPDKKIMIIMATNRMQDLDEAVLSRMDHKIYIGPPEIDERIKIIEKYAFEFFGSFTEDMKRFFNKEATKKMAQEISGFTGRAIFKLMNTIASKKSAHANNLLTDEMIKQAIEDFKTQEQLIENLRKKQINPMGLPSGASVPQAKIPV